MNRMSGQSFVLLFVYVSTTFVPKSLFWLDLGRDWSNRLLMSLNSYNVLQCLPMSLIVVQLAHSVCDSLHLSLQSRRLCVRSDLMHRIKGRMLSYDHWWCATHLFKCCKITRIQIRFLLFLWVIVDKILSDLVVIFQHLFTRLVFLFSVCLCNA